MALQSTGTLSPVPRGSMPMMSKRSLSTGNRSAPYASTYAAAGAPGPPKLKNSEPMRLPGLVAGDFATAMSNFPPLGLS